MLVAQIIVKEDIEVTRGLKMKRTAIIRGLEMKRTLIIRGLEMRRTVIIKGLEMKRTVRKMITLWTVASRRATGSKILKLR